MDTAHRILSRPPTTAPAFIRLPNALVRRLIRLGVPFGPNTLLTIRGRKTGEPRTVPVAVTEVDGHRWVIGAYGDVNWVRNLRAAGEGVLVVDGRETRVRAQELDQAAAEAFYRDVIVAFLARQPRILQAIVRPVFRFVAPDVLTDPVEAARMRPVFELDTM